MSKGRTITHEMKLTWAYASGDAVAQYSEGLKDKRIEAIKCPKCARRYLPPRPFCGKCNVRMSDWVPVEDKGVLEAWTVMFLPIVDGRSGKMREAPYGMGLIRLDGADTTLNHYLAEHDPEKLRVGQRVKAVWRDDLHGAMDDILHFEVIE